MVAFKAGFGYRIVNLDTGKSDFTLEKPEALPVETGKGAAGRSFRVLSTDKDPPSQRKLDMGIFDVTVSGAGPRFTPRRRRRKGRR